MAVLATQWIAPAHAMTAKYRARFRALVVVAILFGACVWMIWDHPGLAPVADAASTGAEPPEPTFRVEPPQSPATNPRPQRSRNSVGDAPEPVRARALLQHGSLRGTERDGRVTLGSDGRLQPDVELRRLFDYYLSLVGELDPGAIRSLVQVDLSETYGETTAQQVLPFFDRYLHYLRELQYLAATSDPAQRLRDVRALRRLWLGDAADALFGDEAAYADYSVERIALMRGATLDPAQREAQLESLDSSLPPDERAARQEAGAAVLADTQLRQFDALGMDGRTRRAERAALWGEQAATRLAALDHERAIWDERLRRYRRERTAVEDDARIDAAQRQAMVDALLSRSFNEYERRRVASLEAVGALPPGG